MIAVWARFGPMPGSASRWRYKLRQNVRRKCLTGALSAPYKGSSEIFRQPRGAGQRLISSAYGHSPVYAGYPPKICGGEPVIKGTRVTLRTVPASLAVGSTIEEVLADFPTLSEDDVRAVIAFAAASAGEDLPVPAIPGKS